MTDDPVFTPVPIYDLPAGRVWISGPMPIESGRSYTIDDIIEAAGPLTPDPPAS